MDSSSRGNDPVNTPSLNSVHTNQIISDHKLKANIIRWASRFKTYCILDSNAGENPQDKYSKYDLLAGVGEADSCDKDFDDLNKFRINHKWCFGFIGYDLKNQTEDLTSKNLDNTGLPSSFLFAPETVIAIRNGEITIYSSSEKSATEIIDEISSYDGTEPGQPQNLVFKQEKKEVYLANVNSILDHIHKGDIYELNYCQELFSEGYNEDPVRIFNSLNKHSSAPFSAFLKFREFSIICSSPERFVAKRGSRLISQPIKGTIKRGGDEVTDQALRSELYNSAKERSENVMIVDLVRNDLTKVSKPATTHVEELFGIYGFKAVSQMISTIVAESDGRTDIETVKGLFPMGSMTGAPKIRAMQLIDDYESFKRGAYSGALGYFDDEGDFDLNVIIRSILYNSETGYISYRMGSAITALSDPEKEYEECQLKADILNKVFKDGREA